MRILTAVFSYNRGELLANCLDSLRQLDPAGAVAIFDDASDAPDVLARLERAEREGSQVIRTPLAAKEHHGSLYRNMNRALELAGERGFDLVCFVQDDMQALWRRPDLEAHAEAVFAAFPRASQLQIHFSKRLGNSRVTSVDGLRAYRVNSLAGDLGLFHVARVKAAGLVFGPDERSWSRRARELGLESLATADPVFARVPWPRSARYGRMRGPRREQTRGLLLRPLAPAEIRRLTSRDPRQRPWGEDWIVPNGWRCWRPFPHDPSWYEWLYTMARAAVRQRSFEGLVPRRVGTDLEEPSSAQAD